ncbi:MAG: gliding motility-associated C-terminal domain-containing protein, partial [Flavobacterium micromati]|nr:gliding motility-associated C-terminal domain-containing protein [Flavobacterium micromati]
TVVTLPTQIGVGSTTYYAQASNGTCSSLTRTAVTLTINLAIIFTAVATQPKCFGEKGFVTLSTPTGGTGTITFNSTPSTNLEAGTYSYTATDAVGCFTTITRTINAAPTQVVLTATATPISCFGGTATVTLNTTGGSGTYTYDAANPALSGLTAGTYIYKVKDLNDCEATVSIRITQPIALPSASAVIVNNSNCVGCRNGSITQTVSGGTMTYTYLWSNGATSKDLANLVAGTYSVEIKDINGCTANYSYIITESGIALVKTGTFSDTNNDGFAQVGEKINYSFIVTNTGNVSLSNIVVTDPMIGLVFTNNNIASLAVGSSSTVAGTYTLTQADVDGGKVTNTALASGKDLNGIDVSDTSGTALNNNTPTVTLLVQQGNISITKDGIYVDSNNDGTTNIGDKITYNFVVTNTGNVTITNVIVSDPLPGLVLTGSPITLNKGASNATQFVGTYSLTQADIDAGAVYNLATVTGTLPFGERVTATSTDPTPCTTCIPKPDCRNCTITILNKNPRLEVIKTAPTSGYSLVGDVLNYNIIVKNVGNVTLFQIVVTDPLTGLNAIIASLAPGASQEFNEDYIVTKIDLETNTVTNTAFATGRTIENLVISDSDILVINKSLVLGCGTILVHNAFSPNGDGINDVFSVENISDTDCYPENSVEIFNRWGVLVFETKNYNNQSNNFEGISRGRTTITQSSGLPAGTYFYILNYTSVDGNGDIRTNQKDGYLYLTK